MNLTDILRVVGFHPYYCNSFEISIENNTFEIEKVDTAYAELPLNFIVTQSEN